MIGEMQKEQLGLILDNIPLFWEIAAHALDTSAIDPIDLEKLCILMGDNINTANELRLRVSRMFETLGIGSTIEHGIGETSDTDIVEMYYYLRSISRIEEEIHQSVAYSIEFPLDDIFNFSSIELIERVEQRLRGYSALLRHSGQIEEAINLAGSDGVELGVIELGELTNAISYSKDWYMFDSELTVKCEDGMYPVSNVGWYLEESMDGSRRLVITEMQVGRSLRPYEKHRRANIIRSARSALNVGSGSTEALLPHHIGLLAEALRRNGILEGSSEVVVVNRERNYYGSGGYTLLVEACLAEYIGNASENDNPLYNEFVQQYKLRREEPNIFIAAALYDGFMNEFNNGENGPAYKLVENFYGQDLAQIEVELRRKLSRSKAYRNFEEKKLAKIILGSVIKDTKLYSDLFQDYPSSRSPRTGMRFLRRSIHLKKGRYESRVGIITDVDTVRELTGELRFGNLAQDSVHKENGGSRKVTEKQRKMIDAFFPKFVAKYLANELVVPREYSAYKGLESVLKALCDQLVCFIPADARTRHRLMTLLEKNRYDPVNGIGIRYDREIITARFPTNIGDEVDCYAIADGPEELDMSNIRGTIDAAHCVGRDQRLCFNPIHFIKSRTGSLKFPSIMMSNLGEYHRPGICNDCPIRYCGITDGFLVNFLVPLLRKYHEESGLIAFEKVINAFGRKKG